VPDLEPDPNQDPLVRGTDPRIRIHTKMSRIGNIVLFCIWNYGTVRVPVPAFYYDYRICAQVCALQQLGYLTRRLGTLSTSLLTEPSLRLLDTVLSCLLSGSVSVRLAAAGCLRHLCAAVPAVLTPLIDKSVEALETYKSAQEAVSGYSGGLAALLGAVRSVFVLEVIFFDSADGSVENRICITLNEKIK
jgi:hypothetical protein